MPPRMNIFDLDNKRQAIMRTDDGLVSWRMYAALGLSGLGLKWWWCGGVVVVVVVVVVVLVLVIAVAVTVTK